ncbi:MAG TPA: cytochrome-c peroxidase [Albitalea sp.]|uniref:cytochrome-c peroxidase n=1 Tax=Piscinibacter sp. TaxID=1903157 RepID=UPI002ED140FC
MLSRNRAAAARSMPGEGQRSSGRAAQRLLVALLGAAVGAAVAQADEPILPIPPAPALDARKLALGQALFHDKRLSNDNTLSCASCHDLSRGGVDGRSSSIGIGGAKGPINAPTVFNSSLNFRQFWDGRAASLEEQAAGPVHNPLEMGSNWAEVLGKLSRDAPLVEQFKAAYPDGLQSRNIQDAIATFERSLTTPNARIDRYLRGDKSALSPDELRGYQLFKAFGCVACHQGVNVGGNMFQTFGVMGDYFTRRGSVTAADLGRYNVTRNDADRYAFKVPSLRNVAVTAPYFHDGSARTLNEAVDVMFKYQLGRSAAAQDKELIVKFLHTLTGEYQGRSLQQADPLVARRP